MMEANEKFDESRMAMSRMYRNAKIKNANSPQSRTLVGNEVNEE
jgi:hypothetical protein